MSIDLYDRPGIYDILFSPGTAGTIATLERLARRLGPAWRGRQTWLEPACGSGRHLRAAARRGHSVIGFDRNRAMIEYARSRSGGAPRPRLFVADMVGFEAQVRTASVHLAFNVDNTIRHLDTDRAVRAHLAAVAAVLRPGALYVVGMSFHRPGVDGPTEDVWTGRRGRCRVTEVVQYLPPEGSGRREEVLAHLTVDRPGGREEIDWRYHLRSWTVEQWRRMLRGADLEWIATVDAHGDAAIPGVFDYQLLVLRRPAGSRSRSGSS